MTNDEDTTAYMVVVNHEEQYSIWPANRELPLGWQAEGFRGDKAACLAPIRLRAQERPVS